MTWNLLNPIVFLESCVFSHSGTETRLREIKAKSNIEKYVIRVQNIRCSTPAFVGMAKDSTSFERVGHCHLVALSHGVLSMERLSQIPIPLATVGGPVEVWVDVCASAIALTVVAVVERLGCYG